MTLLCHIRVGHPQKMLVEAIEPYITVTLEQCIAEKEIKLHNSYTVFLNGEILGFVADGPKLVSRLRKMRRNSAIPFDTTVYIPTSDRFVMVNTYAGCFMRPLFVVENMHKIQPIVSMYGRSHLWERLMTEGVIEYLDKLEEETSLLAMHASQILSNSTHCEIHPIALLGLCSSRVPFFSHNQGPRNSK